MRIISLLAIALLAGGAAFTQNSSPSPANPAHSATSLPQDRHEGMTISADCYNSSGRAKDKFGKANPLPVGILPVEVFLSNETTQPIRINLDTIQLAVHFESGRHQDIDWLPVEEVARVIAHPHGPSNPKAPRFPIGVPSGTDKKVDQLVDILRPLALDADIVPPMGSVHGFLFFDLNHDLSLAEHASLYVPNATNIPANKPLMFFEVVLGKT